MLLCLQIVNNLKSAKDTEYYRERFKSLTVEYVCATLDDALFPNIDSFLSRKTPVFASVVIKVNEGSFCSLLGSNRAYHLSRICFVVAPVLALIDVS